MSKQMSLFEEPLPSWISRLWAAVDCDKRQEILRILAEMGSKAVAARRAPGKAEEGGRG